MDLFLTTNWSPINKIRIVNPEVAFDFLNSLYYFCSTIISTILIITSIAFSKDITGKNSFLL